MRLVQRRAGRLGCALAVSPLGWFGTGAFLDAEEEGIGVCNADSYAEWKMKIVSTMCLTGLTMFYCMGTLALAQTARFKARLSPVAMDASMRTTVAGSGSVSAELTGSRLTIHGSFEGLLSSATAAQVRHSAVTGVVGPVIFELTITRAANGAISGTIDLTPEQIEALRKGRLYVQVNSEKAPAGNLWGWLLS